MLQLQPLQLRSLCKFNHLPAYMWSRRLNRRLHKHKTQHSTRLSTYYVFTMHLAARPEHAMAGTEADLLPDHCS